MSGSSDSFDALLQLPPFQVERSIQQPLLLEALTASWRAHFKACPAYRRYCENRGLHEHTAFNDFADFPWLPVQAFKGSADILRSVPEDAVRTRLYSSATSGVASEVPIDRVTARRQVKALAAVLEAVFGGQRRPFIVVDVDPQRDPQGLGARAAAVRGFLNLAREVTYVMQRDERGGLFLDEAALLQALSAARERGEPVVLFGFTYVLYGSAIAPMLGAGQQAHLPEGSWLAHIGGWKRLAERQVSRDQFARQAQSVWGIEPARILDFYGFTEQMGVTHPDDGYGNKLCPPFAEVLVRDPKTMEVLPDGLEGLLQFLSPLPASYPGVSVLTDDTGRVISRERGADGRIATRFQVIGRAQATEVRGCGDIMADKLVRGQSAAATNTTQTKTAFLLYGEGHCHARVGNWWDVPDWDRLPQADLTEVTKRLRAARAGLTEYRTEDLIALLSELALAWDADPLLTGKGMPGLPFLRQWCTPAALRRMADAALRGRRAYLDGFLAVDGQARTLMKAEGRGLVVHWLSGNVPALAMLALVQSILCRNVNLLKASRQFAQVLPRLLAPLYTLKITVAHGREISGQALAKSIVVLWYDRGHLLAAEALSQAADVRLAWGGAEAVSTVAQLPRRYDCEDIIYGPKLSYAVLGREVLATERQLAKMARGVATDASVFDQYACASPHTLFVERGAAGGSLEAFMDLLADEMDKALLRIPAAPLAGDARSRIQRLALRHELEGKRIWQDRAGRWTLLLETEDPGLAEPCYGRVLVVKPVDDVMEAAQWAHTDIQTIGLGLGGARRLEFAERAAAKGVYRFPDIGRMTHFESPWDGMFAMERMVRWVTLGGPL